MSIQQLTSAEFTPQEAMADYRRFRTIHYTAFRAALSGQGTYSLSTLPPNVLKARRELHDAEERVARYFAGLVGDLLVFNARSSHRLVPIPSDGGDRWQSFQRIPTNDYACEASSSSALFKGRAVLHEVEIGQHALSGQCEQESIELQSGLIVEKLPVVEGRNTLWYLLPIASISEVFYANE